MRLCEALGLTGEESWPEELELRARYRAHMARAAEQIQRAGVVVTLADLVDMTDLEREVLAEAGERVRAREALAQAEAMAGRPAVLAAVLDGGEALVDEALDDFAAALGERLDGAQV